MSPRRYEVDPTKGRFDVEWPLFGELSRALALKVAREYDPEIVVGVATAGVIPGAVVAAILEREFRSILISRRDHEHVRETPAVLGAAPQEVRGRRVLIVDETCDSGDDAAAGGGGDRQRRGGRGADRRLVPHRKLRA